MFNKVVALKSGISSKQEFLNDLREYIENVVYNSPLVKKLEEIKKQPFINPESDLIKGINKDYKGSFLDNKIEDIKKGKGTLIQGANGLVENLGKMKDKGLFELYSLPELHYLALQTAGGVDSLLDIDLLLPRLKAMRTVGDSFEFNIDEVFAKKVMEDKVLKINEVKKMYGNDTLPVRREFIMAGGDATRYLKILRFVIDNAKDLNNVDELKKLADNNTYKDIGSLICNEVTSVIWDTIKTLFKTPIFKYTLDSSELNNVNKVFEEGNQVDSQTIQTIKELFQKVLNTFNDSVPKAMNYGLEVTINNDNKTQSYSLSFFMASLLSIYASVLKEKEQEVEEKEQKAELYFMVRTENEIKQLQEMITQLFNKKILDKEKLSVFFMTRTKDSIPLHSDIGKMLFDNQGQVLTSSTGHGPALFKGSNEIFNNIRKTSTEPVVFCVRTVDNCGSDINEYSLLAQQRAIAQYNQRGRILDTILKDKEGIQQLILQNDQQVKDNMDQLFEHYKDRFDILYDYDFILEPYVDENLTWFDKISNIIKVLPISAPITVEDPTATGGGLYVNIDNQYSIVDKKPPKKLPMRFNPMLYAVAIRHQFEIDSFEEGTIMLANKAKEKPAKIQGESASTHIVTNPKKVLKSVIDIEHSESGRAFREQKTLNQSVPRDAEDVLNTTQSNLAVAIEKISNNAGVDVHAMMQLISDAQTKVINSLNGSINN